MSPRGPSWALKSLFKNLKKPKVVSRFWVQRPPKRASRNPRAAQEAPKELQRPMQKTAKKNPKKCLCGKKCLGLAISFCSFFWPNFGGQNCTFLSSFFTFCVNFSGNFWNPFWGPFLDQIGPREAKMNPRGPSRASKSQKTAFSKKWFSRGTFTIFSLLGPPKRASRGPRRLPKDTQRTPRPQKRDPKLDPKIIKNWTNFGATLGKTTASKKTKMDPFLGPPSPASQGSK